MKYLYTFLIIILYTITVQSQQYDYDFQNPNLSISDRVDDLINRMTLEEKINQLLYNAPAIDRLDVPEYNWWNESLHGVARNGKATVFPQAIGLAATFDTDLIHRIGVAISDEARGKFNANRKMGYLGQYAGLTFWSPNVNLFRDPRWGRGQETYGEDPFLSGQIGTAFVKGMQGNGKYMKVAAMAKHYVVHSGPEIYRHEFNAEVSDYDLWNTYLPAFRTLVLDANVEGIMGAYNRTNDIPCCAHPYLIQDVLRKKWKFDGYFVSDCGALIDLYNGHGTSRSQEAAAADALNTGCNLNCGSTYKALGRAIEQGLTSEKAVDANLRELLPTRFRLGLFEPEGMVPYDNISIDVVRSPEHITLSYEAAGESIVLLKNKDNLLPLDPDIKKVYVTGPMAAHAQALLANYYGVSDDLRTILEGVAANVAKHTVIRYVQGALMDRPNVNKIDWFSGEAAEAEVTIACVGISQLMEGEEGEAIASPFAGDRKYIALPPHQIEYIKLLRSKANKLVVVITGGSAISIPEIHELADAVIYAWYPGEQGGQAVGDMIFGKINPSGKLPVTFVKSIEDLPPYEDYSMTDRTYRYFVGEPLYPFGFGLSYSQFEYSDMEVSTKTFRKRDKLTLDLVINNTSDVAGEEVVQVYISKRNKSEDDPNYSLKAFQRVMIDGGAESAVSFQLDSEAFSEFDKKGDLKLEKGTYDIYVGGAMPIQRSIDLGSPEWKIFTVEVK